jgi:enoyl-CoA hydratase/carnithine racemase
VTTVDPAQLRLTRHSPGYWRVTIDNPPINVMGREMVVQFQDVIISQWEVGVGMVAGGGPMARLPHLIGRNRALEVLLSSEDIRGEQAEAYGYVNRALPDAELDAYVEALATRIARFDKWAIANTKRLVNTSLPPDVELAAGWDACIASLGRPAAQDGIKALMDQGFHKPGDVENRLGYYVGQIPR